MTTTQYYYFTRTTLHWLRSSAPRNSIPPCGSTLPNTHFDPQLASDLYNRYHDEYQVADEVGFDGIMINEHHTAPFCMQASINITGTVLAKITGASRSSCWATRCQSSITRYDWPKSWP